MSGEIEIAKAFNSLEKGFKHIFNPIEGSATSQSFKLLKFAFSFLFGLQIAVLASLMLGAGRTVSEFVEAVQTRIIPNMFGKGAALFSPAAIEEFGDNIGKMVAKTWSELGFYSLFKIAKQAQNLTENFLAESGLGTTDKEFLQSFVANSSPKFLENMTKSISNIDKKVLAEEITKGATDPAIDQYSEEALKIVGTILRQPNTSPSQPAAQLISGAKASAAPDTPTN